MIVWLPPGFAKKANKSVIVDKGGSVMKGHTNPEISIFRSPDLFG